MSGFTPQYNWNPLKLSSRGRELKTVLGYTKAISGMGAMHETAFVVQKKRRVYENCDSFGERIELKQDVTIYRASSMNRWGQTF
jgi:hypothetical protein